MPTTFHIYDANSWVRRALESDETGLPLRNLITDMNLSPAIPVFVWDGPGGNKRRRDLFPGYKAKRGPVDPGVWEVMTYFKTLLLHTKAIQITVPGYEGDDTIAALVGTYAAQVNIEILSTDRDLFALCTFPNVTHAMVKEPKVPADLLRLYKATVGDPSDNVPGIKGFGETSWEKCNKDVLFGWYLGGCPPLADPDVVAENFGMSKGSANWLVQNIDLARTFWTIIGFFPPTLEELEKYTTVGVPDKEQVNHMLRKFHQ